MQNYKLLSPYLNYCHKTVSLTIHLLFKIVILIYKIISHISNFFSDKSNHNKMYDQFYFFNKMNDQT
jgi:hypothetical protein